MVNQRTDFQWFKKNLSKLYEIYPDKYVIIRDKQVKGDFDTENKALEEARKTFGLGNYIVQKVESSVDNLIWNYHTFRADFATY
jgi:hypothetical protein